MFFYRDEPLVYSWGINLLSEILGLSSDLLCQEHAVYSLHVDTSAPML